MLVGPRFDAEAFDTVTRIVVPVDGSPRFEQILPVAGHWSRAIDAPLEVVTVLATTVEHLVTATGHIDALADGYLRRTATTAGVDRPRPGWDTSHGDDPADAIVDHAARVDPGRVDHPRSPPASRGCGSAASPCAWCTTRARRC